MTSGQLVCFLYGAVYFLCPMVSHILFGQTDWSIYYYTHPAPWVLALIAGTWLLIASPILRIKVSVPRFRDRSSAKLRAFLRKYTLTLAILIALTVGLIYSPSLASFRYVDSGLSYGGWQLILTIILKSVAAIVLLWLLTVFKSQNLNIKLTDRISVWLLTMVLLYTVDGTGSFLSAILFLIFAVSPKFFTNLILTKTNTPLFSARAVWNFCFVPLLFIALIFLSLIIGEGIKSKEFSFDVKLVIFSLKWLAVRIVDGVSSHYYAFVQFFDPQTYRILEKYDYPLSYYLQSSEYRMGTLLGVEVVRPEVQSLSRLNFLVNSFKISATEGTSPGVLASFLYILPLPLGLFAAFIYLRWVTNLIDQLFDLQGFKLSIFGGIFVLQQLLFLYQSPLDFLLIFDNSVILLFLVWLFARMTTNARLNKRLEITQQRNLKRA